MSNCALLIKDTDTLDKAPTKKPSNVRFVKPTLEDVNAVNSVAYAVLICLDATGKSNLPLTLNLVAKA